MASVFRVKAPFNGGRTIPAPRNAAGSFNPNNWLPRRALETLANFLPARTSLVGKVARKISVDMKLAKDAPVVLMVANRGVLDVLANFKCSARAAGIATDNALVFAADESTGRDVEGLGLAAFHDPGLGDLPEAASAVYGDQTFVKIMWLKMTSLYLVTQTERPVLFQDVDVVWFRNPLEYFETAAQDTHIFFQDDGARSERYAPFYANSGFLYTGGRAENAFLLDAAAARKRVVPQRLQVSTRQAR